MVMMFGLQFHFWVFFNDQWLVQVSVVVSLIWFRHDRTEEVWCGKN